MVCKLYFLLFKRLSPFNFSIGVKTRFMRLKTPFQSANLFWKEKIELRKQRGTRKLTTKNLPEQSEGLHTAKRSVSRIPNFLRDEWQNVAANARELSFGWKQRKEPIRRRLRPMFLHKGLACVFVSVERKKNFPIFSFGMLLRAPDQAVTTLGSFCL